MFQINRELAALGIEWTPRRIYYLETWRYPEVESPTRWNIRDGLLEDFQVEEWLNQRGEFSPPVPPAEVGNRSHGGIRLLACNYHLFPKTSVGMSPETFGLYEIGNYMLSLTYDMSSHWTTALLAGESIVDMASTIFNRSSPPLAPLSPCDVVREYLMSSPTLWDHPLMLPCIVLSHHLRRLQHHCNRDLTPTVMGIEAQLGVTRVGRRNFDARPRSINTIKDGPVARAQSEHLTVTINTQLTRVGFTAHNPKWNYEASALLERIVTELAAYTPALRPEANEEILGVLDHNITLAKSLEDNVLGLQKRLELQLNVLYSFVAQTDNRLSARLAATAGRDSTSMKILAFITTIFLPGSYVATLFSMNMFNWEDGASDSEGPGSGGSTISPQFWIYWTVAAPLTALTLAGWALWWSFEKHRYDEHLEGDRQNSRVKIPPWWRRILENRDTLNPDLTAADYLRFAQQRYETSHPRSKAQHQRATSHLPGGNTRSVLHATPFPLCMQAGKGNRLVDVDGHEYLDCMGDMTACLYGHSHPVIMKTVDSTMKSIGMNLGSSTSAEAHFAEALCDRFASIDNIRFCNSGTEANLYALSVARQSTGRTKIIVFEGAYHGGVLSFAHGIVPNNVDKDDWILGQYNDINGAVQLINENRDIAAAVLVEGMQGAGGCIPGSADFLHAIQDAARGNGIIFILDEVMTSRLAPGGLQSILLHPDHGTPLRPDLTTFGKWIGGGLSIGAFGGRRDLMSVYDPHTSIIHHSGTFNNNTLTMNVGCKGLTSVYTPEACTSLNNLGDELRSGLQELAKGTKMAVTGVGAVMNIHFVRASGSRVVARISDLEVKPGSVEEALRDLIWFYLIERGFWIARRGMISLILGTGVEEAEQLKGVVGDFLEDFRELMLLETFLSLLPVAASATAVPTHLQTPSDLIVATSSGIVHGIYNDTAHRVRAFLGIPYAEPATGDLRFAPPQPRAPSQHPINAASFGAPCPQVYNYDNESIWSVLPYRIWNAEDMSEECLFVNIWTPAEHQTKKSTTGRKGKAVMLFIHGGGFGEGAGSVGFYDGVDLASNGDVVVVTFNYRLNVFGYPNAPGLDLAEQNPGLLDQRLAVQWVHQNIANFGGDPDRILLFGQSAGGASVDAYAYAYPEDPLVSGFVLQSGTVSLFNNADTAHASWNRLSTAVGCGAGDGSLACMRSVPFPRILDALSNGSYTFTPVVDNRTVFSDYIARAKDGGLARLPTLAGINAREFSAGFPLSQSSINETAVTEDLFGSFSCPAYQAVKTRLRQHIPTWRYVYHGNFTNLSPKPWLGAYHSGSWVAFAQNCHTGLEEYGWPLFNFNESTLVNLAVDNRPGAVLGSAEDWDGHCRGDVYIG
ncbi:Alpha/Beta hydrolase protein [Aspergillus foveolatus]|uniref:Alpha/Beta hydrolase protein n=1 Tax=Aspergillus foveolatus TaxID=210207 RepID=UPI003CCE3A5B